MSFHHHRGAGALSPWVRFPLGDPGYRDTGEGSLAVKLVIQSGHRDPRLMNCAYSREVIDTTCEHLIADLIWMIPNDQALEPRGSYLNTSVGNLMASHCAWLRRELAELSGLRLADACRETADQHLAVMTLADIDWVGYYRKTDSYWSCAYQLLTPRGKLLYNHLAGLYPGATLHLLTLLRLM